MATINQLHDIAALLEQSIPLGRALARYRDAAIGYAKDESKLNEAISSYFGLMRQRQATIKYVQSAGHLFDDPAKPLAARWSTQTHKRLRQRGARISGVLTLSHDDFAKSAMRPEWFEAGNDDIQWLNDFQTELYFTLKAIDDAGPRQATKPKWKNIRDRCEKHVRKHGWPGINALARQMQCSPSTVRKAVQKSTYLAAREAEARATAGGRAAREVPVTDAVADSAKQTREQDPLEQLIAEQQADERRDVRARQRARAKHK